MPANYPIRAVAKLTGIPIDTLRAWERRYHAVTPDRSGRGRLYNDLDIRRLQLLRAVVEAGHAIGHVASLADPELRELAQAPRAAVSERPAAHGGGSPNFDRLLEAIDNFDADTINQELSKLALLLSPDALVHKVVLPLMRLTGENWENGTFSIAQEHMFSACLRNLLGSLVRIQKPGNGGRLLLSTPMEELHECGILAAAMLAVARDFHVTYLGPNLPAGEIARAAEKCRANIVAVGVMEMNVTPALCGEVSALAGLLPAAIELWAGGSGAVDAMKGVNRAGAFVLDDLSDFERRLIGWKAGRTVVLAP